MEHQTKTTRRTIPRARPLAIVLLLLLAATAALPAATVAHRESDGYHETCRAIGLDCDVREAFFAFLEVSTTSLDALVPSLEQVQAHPRSADAIATTRALVDAHLPRFDGLDTWSCFAEPFEYVRNSVWLIGAAMDFLAEGETADVTKMIDVVAVLMRRAPPRTQRAAEDCNIPLP